MDEAKKCKALLVTTVSGFIPQFELNNVKLLQSIGYEIHYATNFNIPFYTNNNDRLNGTGIILHQIDFSRSPFNISNFRAYRQLKLLMKQEKFDLLHCHTPMGGVLARLAGKKAKIPYVMYTAHGFHFFKGASFFNWVCYYQVEKKLARYTDVLITINNEDYDRAKKFKLKKNGIVELIPGIGIDSTKELPEVNGMIKKQLGIGTDKIIITSVGELSKRKNHKIVIRAISKLVRVNPNIVYLISGEGYLHKYLERIIKNLKLNDNVMLLGYRNDVKDILRITDCFIFPSLQEGLPVALLEAMQTGLPVVCSNIRGNKDLIIEGKGGYLVNKKSVKDYRNKIELVLQDEKTRKCMGECNKERVKMFDQHIVIEKMTKLYNKAKLIE